MKIRNLILAFALLLTPCFATDSVEPVEPSGESRTISLLASTILMKQHYLKKDVSQANSEEFFREYLETLDPMHLFFTAEQVESWKIHSPSLISRLLEGDVSFAYLVFREYLARLEEYDSFVRNLKLSDADFDGNDVYEIDRSKAAWPENREKMLALWRGKIRNDVISLKLLARIRDEEAKKKDSGDSSKSSGALWNRLSPMEQIRKRADQFVETNRKLDQLEILEMYLNAFAKLYDPHTAYMAPRNEDDFNINMKLSLVGIGAVLSQADDGSTRIVEIMPGGPAEKSGKLHAEDRIIAVAQGNDDPVDVIDMPLQKVVSMIRGEKGTEVAITAWDAKTGSGAPPKTVRLLRDTVQLKDAEAKSEIRTVRDASGKERRIAVITLPSFYLDFDAAAEGKRDYKSSTRDVKNLLRTLSSEPVPVDALVIDLRSNGGGSLREAVTLTGLFIPEGPVVQIRDAGGRVVVENDTDGGKVEYSGPLVVLTNRLSASASEIFAGAIRDYNRGIVVGDSRTHGKGSVQTLIDLNPYLSYLGCDYRGGVVKLTTAKFYRVNGSSTQRRGVEPDIVFPSFTDAMDLGEDQLTNPMPWDTIPAAGIHETSSDPSTAVARLRELSSERVSADPKFKALRDDIARFRRNKEKKTVSLNYEVRWKEYLEEKKIYDEQAKLLKLDSVTAADSSAKKNPEKDLFLEETLRIAADYSSLE